MPFIDQPSSKVSKAVDVVKNSGAGSPERPVDPTYVSPEDRAKETQEKLDAIRGTKSPTTYSGSVDILRLGRILEGYKKTVNAPAVKPAAPVAETYPAVEAAIAKIPSDLFGDTDFDGQEFARNLARQLDIAQKSRQEEITIDIGEVETKDRSRLRKGVETIIALIRQALPHHASNVKYADIRTGKGFLTRGTAESQ
jgi:hypothetical protein